MRQHILNNLDKYESLFNIDGKLEGNMSLSDIMSAVTDNIVTGAYAHSNDYWSIMGNKEREITAGLLTEYISGNKESLTFIDEIPPLKEIMEGLIRSYESI